MEPHPAQACGVSSLKICECNGRAATSRVATIELSRTKLVSQAGILKEDDGVEIPVESRHRRLNA